MAYPSKSKYMYCRVEIEELPEPDYFELEKIYYEPPPPSLLKLAMRWTIRNLFLLFLLTLFLIASVLYITTSIPERPNFNQILRTSVAAQKQIESAEINGAAQQTTTSDGGSVQIDVSGADILNTDGDDIIVNDAPLNVTADGGLTVQVTPSNTTITTSTGSDTESSTSGKNTTANSSKPSSSSESSSSGGNKSSGSSSSSSSSKNTTSSKPPPPPSNGKDGGQVSIQDPTAAEKEPFTPIKATFFSGVDGPTHCRGHVIAVVNLPKPQASGVPTPMQCYNFQNLAWSGCGNFLANKVDGCIANFFEEPNCVGYVNTAAFMPENRAVGGHWRSAQVQCGVPEPDPESLGKPPMVDQISSLVDNDKPG